MDDASGADDVFFACGERFSSAIDIPALGVQGLVALSLLLVLTALHRSR